ncbi:MAG: hypothetical protein K2Q14_02150 [Gammaproteobacteria bacterium]|nr:hypothetical protein [Gammaproteobacteria bacterium]
MSLENAITFIKAGNSEALNELLNQMPELAAQVRTQGLGHIKFTPISQWTLTGQAYDSLLSIAFAAGQVASAICIFNHDSIIAAPYKRTQETCISERTMGDDIFEYPEEIVHGVHPLQSVRDIDNQALTQSAFNCICRKNLYHNDECRRFILEMLTRESINIDLFDANAFRFKFGELPTTFDGRPNEFQEWLIQHEKDISHAQITKADCLRDLMNDALFVTRPRLEQFALEPAQLLALYQHHENNSQARSTIYNFRPEVDPVRHQAFLEQKLKEEQAILAKQAAIRQAQEDKERKEAERYEASRRLVESRLPKPKAKDTDEAKAPSITTAASSDSGQQDTASDKNGPKRYITDFFKTVAQPSDIAASSRQETKRQRKG